MELTEFYRDKDRVIYSTTVNGKDYYFYDGFKDYKEAIDTLTQIIKGKAFEQFIFDGIWSKIIK